MAAEELSGIKTSKDGERYVGGSIRPDGSVRKTFKVRPGFIPVEDQKKYVPRMKRLQQENATTSSGPTDADSLANELKDLSLKPRMPAKTSETPATEASPLITAKNERQESAGKTVDTIARHKQSHVPSQTDGIQDEKQPHDAVKKADKTETSSTASLSAAVETGSKAPAAKYIPPWKREKSRGKNA